MSSSTSCPPSSVLADFAMGRLDVAGIEDISRHLETCSECSEKLGTLQVRDSLLDAVRTPAGGDDQSDPALSELISRLQSYAQTVDSEMENIPLSDRLACLRPAQSPDELGRLGRYRVLQVVGVGGMGTVFLAEDTQVEGSARPRTVALKVMRPGLSEGNRGRKRFLREVQTLVAQDHPAILPVLDVGEDNGVPFFTMPLLRGESLDARLRREKVLPIAETIFIAHEIASGLAAAHERGVIHRDVKPANVFLCRDDDQRRPVAPRPENPESSNPSIEDVPTNISEAAAFRSRSDRSTTGSVKLMDFGLARNVDQTSWQTQAGTVLGTPHYMAPEQIEGRDLDARADLFSLGCVLFRMTTGTLPFTGPSHMSVFVSVTRDIPPNVRHMNPTVPPALEELIEQLLEKQPARRPRSAAEVAERLAAIGLGSVEASQVDSIAPASSSDTEDGTVTVIMSAQPWYAKTSRRTVQVALAMATLLVLGALAFLQTRPGRLNVELASGAASETQIEIVQADTVHLLNALNGWSMEVAPGQWHARLSGDTDQYQLDHDTLTVTRGKTSLLRVTRKPFADRPVVSNGDQPSETVVLPLALPSWTPEPFDADSAIHGLVANPASLPGIKRWQLETAQPRGDLRDMQWSPDGKWLAMADTRQLRIYAFSEGELTLSRIFSDGTAIVSLTWSPDSERIAVSYGGHQPKTHALRVWNRRTGAAEETVKSRDWYHAASVAWSPDGKWLAEVDWGFRNVILYKMPGLVPERELSSSLKVASSVCWSPDSSTIAVGGSQDPDVEFWKLEGTSTRHKAVDDEDVVTALSWSPDGKWLAAGGWKKIQLLSPMGEKGASPLVIGSLVKSAAWSPDSRQFIFGSFGVGICEDINKPHFHHLAPRNGNSQFLVSWHKEGRYIALGQTHSTRVWLHDANEPAKPPRPVIEPNPMVGNLSLARSLSRLAFGATDGSVRAQQVDGTFHVVIQHRHAGLLVFDPPFDRLNWDSAPYVTWTASGRSLFSTLVTRDSYLRAWHADERTSPSWRVMARRLGLMWNADQPTSSSRRIPVASELGIIKARGERIVRAEGGLHELDIDTGEVTQRWPYTPGGHYSISPNGELAAVRREGSEVTIVRLADGKELATLDGPSPLDGTFSWSSDGRCLAIGAQGRFDLWNARTWQRIWQTSIGEFARVSLAPDGSSVVSTLGIHDIETGKLRDSLRFPSQGIQASVWYPNSQRFASESDNFVAIHSAQDASIEQTIIPIHPNDTLVFDAAGNLVQGDLHLLDRECVCLIERDDGTRDIIRPSELLKLAGLTAWPTTNSLLQSRPQESADD